MNKSFQQAPLKRSKRRDNFHFLTPTPPMRCKECPRRMLSFQNRNPELCTQSWYLTPVKMKPGVCLWTHSQHKQASGNQITDSTFSPSLLLHALCAEEVKGEETVIKLLGKPLNCFLLSVLPMPVFTVKLLYRNKGFEVIFRLQIKVHVMERIPEGSNYFTSRISNSFWPRHLTSHFPLSVFKMGRLPGRQHTSQHFAPNSTCRNTIHSSVPSSNSKSLGKTVTLSLCPFSDMFLVLFLFQMRYVFTWHIFP